MNKNYLFCILGFFLVLVLWGCVDDDGKQSQPVVVDHVAGIDEDGNGVWDHVDVVISKKNYDKTTKQMLVQYIKVEQDFLLSGGDKKLALKSSLKMDRAMACIRSKYEFDKGWKMVEEFQSVLLNTEERIRAYFIANALMSGHVFDLIPEDEYASMCKNKN